MTTDRFPTTVAGRPARVDHLDVGACRYLTTVAIDGHWHAVIEDPADGSPVRWRLHYYTPSGWHLDHDGHGYAPTPSLAVAAATAYFTADDPADVGCRYCGSGTHHDDRCTA